MLKTRVIPVLLLKGLGLVKTIKFKNPRYIGDPINAVKIFNDKEVNELIFLDIIATPSGKDPNFDLISQIASEAFMPFGYGGGIRNLTDIEKLFKIGVEKVVLNTITFENPKLIIEASKVFGSQSIVCSIDVKYNWQKIPKVVIHCGHKSTNHAPVDYAMRMEEYGVGEIFLNSIDRDGTMKGYDLDLIRAISEKISIPVIASGGAGSIDDFVAAIKFGKASAVAAGSMFVFNGIHRAVLISYLDNNIIENILTP